MSEDGVGYFMIHIGVWAIALVTNAFAFVLGIVFGNIGMAVLNFLIVCLSILMLYSRCSQWLGGSDNVDGEF